jgi:pyruvate kinase
LAKVIQGGILTSRKGANFPDLELDMPTLVEKDLKALSIIQKQEVDFVGLSFVRSAKDIKRLRKELQKRNLSPSIIAKIETKEAVKNFEEIIEVSDAIMVARGDLAVEFPYQKVPYLQKEIISSCRMIGKPVIVATQMLQSMTVNPRPTRAEISDVANAVYEAADCLMLSEETAAGKFPVKSVATMANIAQFIEKKRQREVFQVDCADLDEVIAEAVYKISQTEYADCQHVDKIIVLTDTGTTARLISRFRPDLQIIAVSGEKQTADKLNISFGVRPFYYAFPRGEIRSTKKIVNFLKKKKAIKKGENILLTHGKKWGEPGKTNTLRIEEVE